MIDHALFDQRLQNRSGPARSYAPASEALPASDRSNRRSQRANLSDNQSRGLLLASKAGPILESASDRVENHSPIPGPCVADVLNFVKDENLGLMGGEHASRHSGTVNETSPRDHRRTERLKDGALDCLARGLRWCVGNDDGS